MAFDVSVWRAVGGFAEHLRTGEDVLFGRAAVARGMTATLVSDAEVIWAQRVRLRDTARMYHSYGEGSGRSRDARLLGRDLGRLAGYAVGAALAARGGPIGRGVAVAGVAAYLSLPLARVLRGAVHSAPGGTRSEHLVAPASLESAGVWASPVPVEPGVVGAASRPLGARFVAAAAVPLVAAVRDLAKATGALRGLWRGWPGHGP